MKPKATPKQAVKQARTAKPGTDRLWVLFSVAVVMASVMLYFNTLQHGYVLDDKGIITGNKFTVKGFSGIPDLLTTSYWEGIGINVRSYRPLSPVTFAMEVGFFGVNPKPSHFGNLLIYALTGIVLLFFLKSIFRRIDRDLPPVLPFLVTLLFLAHPIHTEVVANIKGRDSMLEFLFLVLSARFLMDYLDSRRGRDLMWSVVSFFPALLSKESAITYLVMVPVLLLLFDERPMMKRLGTTACYLLPAALFLLLYFRYSHVGEFVRLHVLDNALIAAPTPAGLLATKLLILGKYLVLLVFPHPLVYDYSYNQIPFTTFSDPAVWITLAVYLAAAGYLVRVLYRRISGQKTASGETLAAFSVAWFFMGFAASSNLFMLIGSTMGERFMYAPSLGFILTVVWLGYRLALLTGKERRFRGHPSLMLYLFCGLLFSAFLLKTIARNRAWKDDFTLYSTDIVHLQNNVKANDFLANAYRERGDKADETGVKQEYYRQAIALKERAVAIYPKVPEIQRQLGELYGNTGQFGKAIGAYGEAVALNPSDAVSHLQIGKAYGMMKQPAEGLTWMEKAEQLDPSNPDVLVALGVTHAQLGHLDRAIGYFERTLARDPSNPVAAKYLDMAKKQSVKL